MQAADRATRAGRHELGSGDGAEGDGGAARQVPEDRRDHLQLRHRRPRRARARSRRRAGRSSRSRRRRERALLPLQEVRASQLATISIAQLARPDRRPQGDRGGRGAAEQGAEPCYNLPLLRGHDRPASRTSACKSAPADFYPSDKITLAQIKKYGNAVGRDDRCPRRSPPLGRRQDVPGSRRAQGRLARRRRGRGPRARGGERRGQVDADGGRRRLDRARLGHGRDRRPPARAAVARRRAGARARGRLPAPLDPRGPDGRREHGVRDAAGAAAAGLAQWAAWAGEKLAAIGAPIDPSARVARARRRRAAAARDREGARARGEGPDPRRADGVADARRGGAALRRRSARSPRTGTAVVYISHRLPEVLRIADRITVLRDGEARGTLRRRGRLGGRGAAADRRPRRSTRSSPRSGGADRRAARAQRARPDRRRASTTSISTSGPARSSASPASRATGSASSCARSPACCPRPATRP